jgi:hypothetical protein
MRANAPKYGIKPAKTNVKPSRRATQLGLWHIANCARLECRRSRHRGQSEESKASGDEQNDRALRMPPICYNVEWTDCTLPHRTILPTSGPTPRTYSAWRLRPKQKVL